jgi:hypothetical protein
MTRANESKKVHRFGLPGATTRRAVVAGGATAFDCRRFSLRPTVD